MSTQQNASLMIFAPLIKLEKLGNLLVAYPREVEREVEHHGDYATVLKLDIFIKKSN